MPRPRRPGGALENLTLRAPHELTEWLQGLAAATPERPELTLSQAALWVLQLGREYLEALPPDLRRRVDVYAKKEDKPRADVLREAIGAGMLVLEATSILPRL
jgi:predicted transcriptional regulator